MVMLSYKVFQGNVTSYPLVAIKIMLHLTYAHKKTPDQLTIVSNHCPSTADKQAYKSSPA